MREIRLPSGLAQRHFHIKMPPLSRYKGSAVRPGSRTKVSVPLVLPQTRHPACPGLPWERSASQIDLVTQLLWRGVEGPRRCAQRRFCGRTNGTETFVREPGRTADPSAALGMTKGRVVTFIRGRQIGWTEKKQQVPPLRFALVPRHAGTGGMTISFKT